MKNEKIAGRVLSYAMAAAYVGLSRTSLYAKAEDDPSFPRPIKLSARRVGFLRGDLDDWLAKRAAERSEI